VLAEVPPLLLQAHPEVLTAIGLLDGDLMLVLDGSRIITEQELARLENSP
jgi:chemotaxis signal transduction protein